MKTLHMYATIVLLTTIFSFAMFSANLGIADAQADNESESTSVPEYVKEDCADSAVNKDNCGIVGYLVIAINTLSALAGVVIIGSIIYAGIQYSMSGSDPQKVGAAKDRIRNAVIALILFIFGYAILNYLVPGGIL